MVQSPCTSTSHHVQFLSFHLVRSRTSLRLPCIKPNGFFLSISPSLFPYPFTQSFLISLILGVFSLAHLACSNIRWAQLSIFSLPTAEQLSGSGEHARSWQSTVTMNPGPELQRGPQYHLWIPVSLGALLEFLCNNHFTFSCICLPLSPTLPFTFSWSFCPPLWRKEKASLTSPFAFPLPGTQTYLCFHYFFCSDDAADKASFLHAPYLPPFLTLTATALCESSPFSCLI